MKRLQLRLRDLLLAVLVIAAFLAAWSWNRRRQRFHQLAVAHRSSMDQYKSIGTVIVGPEDDPIFQAQQLRRAMWREHKDAAEACEAAEWRPWAYGPGDPVERPRAPEASLRVLHVPEDDVVESPRAGGTPYVR
ncbi:hypothetical protein [Aquisphaera insulae]|uniref:hypothetical protein n=1 Tax=Aquisphaera insulae TaxID=2712864 RepID=UPI0013E9D936|nr:hypothetical protein [Aquisphaera insulae]